MTDGRIVSHYNCSGKLFGIKLNISIPHEPSVPLLDVHTTETQAQGHQKTCLGVFILILFVIAKNYKPPNYTSAVVN